MSYNIYMPTTKDININYDFGGEATVTNLKAPIEPSDAVRLQDTEDFGIVVSTDNVNGRRIFVGAQSPQDAGYTPVTGDVWIEV